MFPRAKWSLLLAGMAATMAVHAPAAIFIGGFDGTTIQSNFEPTPYASTNNSNLQAYSGWVETAGDSRVANLGLPNTVVIAETAYGTYSVRYVTNVPVSANTTYRLSFDMGYFTTAVGNSANYSFQVGTWNGSSFTGIGAPAVASINPSGVNIASGNPAGLINHFADFSTTSSPGTDNIAIVWSLNSYAFAANADFFGFDNVQLQNLSVVPEPSTYAAIFGLVGFALVVLSRRKMKRGQPNRATA